MSEYMLADDLNYRVAIKYTICILFFQSLKYTYNDEGVIDIKLSHRCNDPLHVSF